MSHRHTPLQISTILYRFYIIVPLCYNNAIMTTNKTTPRQSNEEPSYSKVCAACDEMKPIEKFWKQSASKDGHMIYCSICADAKNREWRKKNRIQAQAIQRAYYARKKGLEKLDIRSYKVKFNYLGIDQDQYDALLKRQHYKCAICKATSPRKHGLKHFIGDYSPLDGSLRGLLCAPCDIIMDMAGEDAKLLRRASSYLQRHDPAGQP